VLTSTSCLSSLEGTFVYLAAVDITHVYKSSADGMSCNWLCYCVDGFCSKWYKVQLLLHAYKTLTLIRVI